MEVELAMRVHGDLLVLLADFGPQKLGIHDQVVAHNIPFSSPTSLARFFALEVAVLDADGGVEETFLTLIDVPKGELAVKPIPTAAFDSPLLWVLGLTGGILAVDGEGSLTLWDRDGQLAAGPLELGGPTALAFTDPSERLGLFTQQDGRLLLVDLESGQDVGFLLGDRSGDLIGLASVTDRNTVWLGQTDRWIEVPLDPHVWQDRACQLAGRELTDEEWAEFIPGDEPRRDICSQ